MMPEAEEGGQAPQEGRLPAFDLTVDRFGLGERWLGALALRASLAPGRWSLDALTLEVPAVFRIDASGVWRDGERPQTEFATKMTIEDAGKTVRHWFDTAGLKGGKGQVTAQWRWLGSPLGFDLYKVGRTRGDRDRQRAVRGDRAWGGALAGDLEPAEPAAAFVARFW